MGWYNGGALQGSPYYMIIGSRDNNFFNMSPSTLVRAKVRPSERRQLVSAPRCAHGHPLACPVSSEQARSARVIVECPLFLLSFNGLALSLLARAQARASRGLNCHCFLLPPIADDCHPSLYHPPLQLPSPTTIRRPGHHHLQTRARK